MINLENRVENLTKRSIDSLYILNSVRDYLYLYTPLLKSFGVERIVAFGSVVRGEAQTTSLKRNGQPSDIDLMFILTRKNCPTESEKDFSQRKDLVRKFVGGLERHITSDVKLSSFINCMTIHGDYPMIVQDPLPLWEATY